MTPENFCYWLQGMLETVHPDQTLTFKQAKALRDHLALVFEKVTPDYTEDDLKPQPQETEPKRGQFCDKEYGECGRCKYKPGHKGDCGDPREAIFGQACLKDYYEIRGNKTQCLKTKGHKGPCGLPDWLKPSRIPGTYC